MIKEGTLEHQGESKNKVSKSIGKYNRFHSPPEFSKLCLTIETKITITLSSVVLNVCKGNI